MAAERNRGCLLVQLRQPLEADWKWCSIPAVAAAQAVAEAEEEEAAVAVAQVEVAAVVAAVAAAAVAPAVAEVVVAEAALVAVEAAVAAAVPPRRYPKYCRFPSRGIACPTLGCRCPKLVRTARR